MAQDPISLRSDENFRKGACHGAAWLARTSARLAEEGYTAPEIAGRLGELARVLAEWRAQGHELPDGNPWDWSLKDLASVVRELGN